MKIGLIGIANSGKTTIFNALTGFEHETSDYTNPDQEPGQALIQVMDSRITHLSKIYEPKKTIYATVELMDFPGFSEDSGDDGIPASTLAEIKNLDAVALVIRNFDNDLLGPRNPVKDLEYMREELIITDQIQVEKRLEKIQTSINRGKKTPELLKEQSVLETFQKLLEDGQPLSELSLTEEEGKLTRGFQFLTRKPVLIILNSDEDNFMQDQEVVTRLEETNKILEFAGNFEMELAQLEDDESRELFMADMGITVSSADRLTQYVYEVLGYISFFTVGSDEVRAWTIRKRTPAVDAAGAIHNDISRGFIRAECFTYEDLVAYGDEKILKQNGKTRLEGKTYIVQDGDIINFRFNV